MVKIDGRKRPDRLGKLDKYAGYLYCAECGSRLYLHREYKKGKTNHFFQCGGYQTHGKSYCTVHSIGEIVLDEIILQSLQRTLRFAKEETEAFYQTAMEKGEKEAEKLYRETKMQITEKENRIKEIDNVIMCLYEDRVSGRITTERYEALSARYEEEQKVLKDSLNGLRSQVSEAELKERYVNDFITKAKEYTEISKITPQILRQFVRKIFVHERAQKYSRKEGNVIEIVYAFEMPKDKSQHDMVIFEQ